MSEPEVVTDRAAFRAAARDAAPGARIPVEVRLQVDDPFAAYRRARGGEETHRGPSGAFLETTGGQTGWGYFGVDPVERVTVQPDAEHRDAGRGDEPAADPGRPPDRMAGAATSPTLASLQARLDATSLVRGDCDVPFPCGAIGWLSYDVVRELEALPSDAVADRDLPRLQLAVFDRLAAWECPASERPELRITACPALRADQSTAATYRRGRERAHDLVERIRSGDPGVPDAGRTASSATFESDCSAAGYGDRVRAIKRAVRAGETFQTNVARCLSAPAAVHPVAAYAALRRVNPAPYSALLELPDADLVSASPELLLERRGDRLRTEPIAGTRPRADDEGADDALEAELRSDEKERAEHAMLVDLERNDLGAVAAYGSVDVTEYRRVDRYSEVMHLVSLVEGRLREGATLADAIAAIFPGGTVTGAPKPRTMELIDELEGTRRGPYTGSIGIFGFDDRATLNIVIRTLVRHGGRYDLRVGAGIVHDSVPEREHEETLDKARALVNAVDEALGTRATLSVDAGGEAS